MCRRRGLGAQAVVFLWQALSGFPAPGAARSRDKGEPIPAAADSRGPSNEPTAEVLARIRVEREAAAASAKPKKKLPKRKTTKQSSIDPASLRRQPG